MYDTYSVFFGVLCVYVYLCNLCVCVCVCVYMDGWRGHLVFGVMSAMGVSK